MTRKGSDRMLATNEEMQRMDLRAVEEGACVDGPADEAGGGCIV